MTNQITLEEVLELVTFKQYPNNTWLICDVKGTITGDVIGSICGNVGGDVGGYITGSVFGDVCGDVGGIVGRSVGGKVWGTINGREWEYVETPKDKLKRLIREGSDQKELLWAVDQLEDN